MVKNLRACTLIVWSPLVAASADRSNARAFPEASVVGSGASNRKFAPAGAAGVPSTVMRTEHKPADIPDAPAQYDWAVNRITSSCPESALIVVVATFVQAGPAPTVTPAEPLAVTTRVIDPPERSLAPDATSTDAAMTPNTTSSTVSRRRDILLSIAALPSNVLVEPLNEVLSTRRLLHSIRDPSR
ncbi:MAG TPA: hypothetical protein VE777_15455 [Gaiellales bacterium]|nr:hypothetical protein [Gaiellales bacterium]